MAANAFGVTFTTLKEDHFPWFDPFSANSNPTSTVVARFIAEKAAALHGRLKTKGIDASDWSDVAAAEYLWCRETVTIWAAIRTMQVMTGVNPALAQGLQKDLDARLKELSDGGLIAIGGTAGDDEEDGETPDGPHTHISEYDLDDGDPATDASDVIPELRRSDEL